MAPISGTGISTNTVKDTWNQYQFYSIQVLTVLLMVLAAIPDAGVSIFHRGIVLCCRFSNHASFQEILNELNDYAGQRELIAENLITSVCVNLTKYLQDLKQERKSVSRWPPSDRSAGQRAALLTPSSPSPPSAPVRRQKGPADPGEQLQTP